MATEDFNFIINVSTYFSAAEIHQNLLPLLLEVVVAVAVEVLSDRLELLELVYLLGLTDQLDLVKAVLLS